MYFRKKEEGVKSKESVKYMSKFKWKLIFWYINNFLEGYNNMELNCSNYSIEIWKWVNGVKFF